MAMVQVRATVTLPEDAAGNRPVPGDVFYVDDSDAHNQALMRVGYLVPLVRLPMPSDLLPAAERKRRATTGGSDADGESEAAGGAG